jgi:YHS domain-containing protein
MRKDPVCGMQVDEKKAGATAAYKGTTYHFCSPACKTKFDATPEKFTGKGAPPPGK